MNKRAALCRAFNYTKKALYAGQKTVLIRYNIGIIKIDSSIYRRHP